MPKKAFSTNLVTEVQTRIAAGHSGRQVARALDVPRSTVAAILRDQPAGLPAPLRSRRASDLPAQPRVLLHPWVRMPQPLPPDVAVHPVVQQLYDDALHADPARASELDVLRIAFALPVLPVRSYLNALSAERLRSRFDLLHDDDTHDVPTGRLTLPLSLWTVALDRLRVAFEDQEREMATARDRLLAQLPATVDPDDV